MLVPGDQTAHSSIFPRLEVDSADPRVAACQTARMTASDSVSESVEIAATPAQVYEAISDVSQMPRWSPELSQVSASHDGPLKVGERFAGYNRKGFQVWRTTSTVTAAKAPQFFAYDVTGLGLPVARWSYRIAPTEGGCELTETWTDLRSGPLGFLMKTSGFAATGVWDRATHNREGMARTLQALKDDLESR